jgi:hypothetical protein
VFKKFKKLEIEDQLISRVQDNIETAINSLPTIAILQGRLVTGVSLSSSITNKISHKLDRNLIGWFIVRQKSSAIVWDTQDANTTPNLTLNLNCSANVVVDLWVF